MALSDKNRKLLKKITEAIGYLCFIIFILLILIVFTFELAALIFMAIRNITGYCTPFMSQVIERVMKSGTEALKLWAGS